MVPGFADGRPGQRAASSVGVGLLAAVGLRECTNCSSTFCAIATPRQHIPATEVTRTIGLADVVHTPHLWRRGHPNVHAAQREATLEVLHSLAVGALAGTVTSAAVVSALLRRASRKEQRAKRCQRCSVAATVESVSEAVKVKNAAAFKNAAKFDFTNLGQYDQKELEELFIDTRWLANRDSELLSEENMQALLDALKKVGSKFPKLSPEEVAFIEASIAYYRGAPILSDEDYNTLKKAVGKSGRRKDMTSFILFQRGNQYLRNEELSKLEDAFKNATQFDFSKLDTYPVAELEELYIDSLWLYHREKRALLSDKEFDQLKATLYKLESRFPTLKRQEVAFVEASIAKYRGVPLVPEDEFQKLKTWVENSGQRKDVTAFLLYSRGEQFMDSEQFEEMKEEYAKMGVSPVDLDQCSLAQLEEMYVDALWAYYRSGVQLLSDSQYAKLKQELQWQGSGFPTLTRDEIDFVKASLAYHRGEPVASDEEWEEMKQKVLASGAKKEVTAFLLYSKGSEILDPDSFDKMQKEMAKLGVVVKKAGTKALEQTLSIGSDRLENDLGKVFLMYIALGFIPTLLSLASFYAVGLFFDLAFIPDPDWGSLLSFEAVPLFLLGVGGGLFLTQRLIEFLDLQNQQILVGVCPSCAADVRQFVGGANPPAEVEYRCGNCGCDMVLNVREKRIGAAGLGAKIEGDGETFDWSKAWSGVKSRVGLA